MRRVVVGGVTSPDCGVMLEAMKQLHFQRMRRAEGDQVSKHAASVIVRVINAVFTPA